MKDEKAAKQTKELEANKTVSNRRMAGHLLTKLKYRDKGLIGLCLVYTFFTSIYPLFGIYLPGLLIREIEQAEASGLLWTASGIPAGWDGIVRNIVIILGGYFILTAVFGYIRHYITNSSYARLSYLRMDYLRDLLQKTMTMDFRYYEDAGFLDRVNRVNRATMSNDTGVELIYRNLFMLPASLISIGLMMGVLAAANLLLLIPPILFFLAVVIALNKSDTFSFSLRDETSRVNRRIYSYNELTQNFAYGKDIRLYGLESTIFSAYRQMIRQALELHERVVKHRYKMSFLPLFFQIAATVLTLVILVSRASAGIISIAQFAVYLSAYVGLTQLLDEVARTLVTTMAESRYVKEAIEFLEEDLNTHSGSRNLPEEASVSIEFENVSFAYPGSDKAVLEHLSMKIAPGEKVALVGINGAGKSTIVKLMTGLHHPTEGRVLINGVDTRDLASEQLFKCFSVVFQSESPLSLTVAEHVAGRMHDIDRDRVESVLRRVGLWEKVAEQANGIDQMLLKIIDPQGMMLSGGEEQKLMLARAAYKDAAVMVLDEPTSALDALAETKVYREFAGLMDEKSALFISHRLASTSFCDRIVLLSGGRVLEDGTHAELMAKRADYYDMFVTQGKYYQDTKEERSYA